MTGLLVNSAVLAVVTEAFGIHYLAGSLVATQASTGWNFVLSERLVFPQDGYRLTPAGRLLRFAAVNNALLLARGPFLVVLVDGMGLHYVTANLLTLVGSFGLRYLVADRIIWKPSPMAAPAGPVMALASASAAPSSWVPAIPAYHPSPFGSRWRHPTRLTVPVGVRIRTGSVLLATVATASAAVVATIGLRLWGIGTFGYNSDEAVYAGQGLTLVGDPGMAEHFSLFRAHPLVLQLVVGLGFEAFGTVDVVGRLVVSVLFGMGSVAVTYLLTSRLYGRRTAAVATLVLATVPYHVIVSRQVMVDTPMGFFIVLCVWCIVRHRDEGRAADVVLAFVALGLAVLSKEVAVLGTLPLLGNLWSCYGRSLLRQRAVWAGGLLFLAVAVPFPATRLISQPDNAGQFLLWQLLREPNHPPDYFLRVLLQFAGPAFVALGLVGLVALVRRHHPEDLIVLWWAGTFLVFFSVWPTKLFPYLFPILPMLAIAVARGLLGVTRAVTRPIGPVAQRSGVVFLVCGLTLSASLALASASTIAAGPTAQMPGLVHFDVEVQTFAGGREVGDWVREHTPANARLLTIGPSVGNVVRFYGDRDSVALSVSNDPRSRNPAYVPVPNPDLAIRNMDVQYALWDAYSADRSAFYNGRLMRYVRKYQGTPVFSVYVDGATPRLRSVAGPPPMAAEDVRLVVYDLQGGNPRAPDEGEGDR